VPELRAKRATVFQIWFADFISKIFISQNEVPDWYKEKLRSLFHFASQLLYSNVLVTFVTAVGDGNHMNKFSRNGASQFRHK
jgi:hypothetical protein